MKNQTGIFVRLFSFILFISLHPSVAGAQSDQEIKSGSAGYIALVSAFAPELDAIKAEIERHPEGKIEKTIVHKGVTFYLGQVRQQKLVVFTTGISIANAAMTTQMAIDKFDIDKLIMMGIAGAARKGLEPGDLAIPQRWYYHDESIYAKPVSGKHGQYKLPDIFASLQHDNAVQKDEFKPNYQFYDYLYPNDVRVIINGWDSPRRMAFFEVTPSLLQQARLLKNEMPAITLDSGDKVAISLGGNGASGSVFVDNADYRNWVNKTFQASVIDMESTAVGQVCFVNEIDWLVIRSVSDLAGADHGENTARLFNSLAAGSAAKFALALVTRLSAVK